MADLIGTIHGAMLKMSGIHTQETLGDRTQYLGASEIGSCPRKTILAKTAPPQHDLATLLRFKRGHMAEDILAEAFTAAGMNNFERQVEVRTGTVVGHLDFVFTSEANKTKAVLEVKTTGTMPAHPYEGWETQIYIQMGLLAQAHPNYKIKGGILALDFGEEGIRLFNGYEPQNSLFQGLLERATSIWAEYQQFQAGEIGSPTMEPGPLCGYCHFFSDCPRFEAEEVAELEEGVKTLLGLQAQEKAVKAQIDDLKKDFLKIVESRGDAPFRVNGTNLRKASRNRKTMNTEKLSEFLQEHGRTVSDFQDVSSFSFLEVKATKTRK